MTRPTPIPRERRWSLDALRTIATKLRPDEAELVQVIHAALVVAEREGRESADIDPSYAPALREIYWDRPGTPPPPTKLDIALGKAAAWDRLERELRADRRQTLRVLGATPIEDRATCTRLQGRLEGLNTALAHMDTLAEERG